jgi:methyl-accepting chemotaxis protein
MTLFEKFYPESGVVEKLSYRERERFNSLVRGDVICTMLFFILAVGLLILPNYRFTGVLMLLSLIIFSLSLIMIKKGHIFVASYLTTCGFVMSNFIINFFVGFADTGFIFFRGTCFAVVMACFNAMISMKKGQLVFFRISSYAILLLSAFTIYFSIVRKDPIEQTVTLFVCMMAIVSANVILASIEKLNGKVVEKAENSQKKTEENLELVTRVLSQTQESLNIGHELNNSTEIASKSSNEINSLYTELLQYSQDLKEQTQLVKETSAEVDNQAGLMNESIQKQNGSLSETSTAITEISANISNINQIAEKRREGMNNVMTILNNQGDLVSNLVKNIGRVKDSSAEISKFVQTVDSIAGQTNLLAMNASIEAAHAGTMGKGFGVIAQEIRKLSEETTKNAKKIAESLQENATVVQETSNSVSAFANSTTGSREEIVATVNSMEEIISGITETNSAMQDIMNSITEVVSLAKESESRVTNVSERISQQDDELLNITNTTENLQTRIENIKNHLQSINNAIADIHEKAKINEEVSGKIASLLD